MKKNLLAIVLGTAAVVTAISCSNKDNFEPAASERVPMQFSAGTPAITKTAIAEDGTENSLTRLRLSVISLSNSERHLRSRMDKCQLMMEAVAGEEMVDASLEIYAAD